MGRDSQWCVSSIRNEKRPHKEASSPQQQHPTRRCYHDAVVLLLRVIVYQKVDANPLLRSWPLPLEEVSNGVIPRFQNVGP